MTVTVKLVPRHQSEADAVETHTDGVGWDLNDDGALVVLGRDGKAVGVHARGEWRSASKSSTDTQEA